MSGSELPYVIHVGMVCMEVMAALTVEPGRDGDLAVQCALLHDVIEDTKTTYALVAAEFGKPVADGVLALTKNDALEKVLQMADSLARIREQPHEVWMVKLADRISNLQPPPVYWTKEKIAAYRAEAEMIHAALRGASDFLAERLWGKITAYRHFEA